MIKRRGHGAQRDTARAIVRDHGLTLADKEEFILRYALAEEAGEVPRASNRKHMDAIDYARVVWSVGTKEGGAVHNGWLLPVLEENETGEGE